MRIGRNFTNMLETSFLTDEERALFKEGKLLVHDMDARVQIRAKRDIINQLKIGREIGLMHVELDGGIPNPFLQMSNEEISAAKEYASQTDMTISLHLPYTYVGAATCAFQDSDREAAVAMQKKYIDIADKLGCVSVVMHPGSVPFYQAMGEYLVMLKESLIKTLCELAAYAKQKDIIFHLENNTAFDSYGVENGEILDVINAVNAGGADIKYCFDIGHWFTRALPQFGKKEIPSPPEKIVEEIPDKLLCEVHLNDFVIEGEKFKFHPPLQRQQGFLKKQNLKNLAGLFRDKGVDVIVVETAVREIDDLLNASDILKEETEYLNEVLGQ